MGIQYRYRTDYIVIHHSATPRDADIGVDTIRRWHVKNNNWLDIGYHYVIKRDGTIQKGRHESAVGAHCYHPKYKTSWPINKTSIAICMVGGLGADGKALNNFTDAQWESLLRLCKSLLNNYKSAKLAAHRKFMPTACPAFDVTHFAQKNGLPHA